MFLYQRVSFTENYKPCMSQSLAHIYYRLQNVDKPVVTINNKTREWFKQEWNLVQSNFPLQPLPASNHVLLESLSQNTKISVIMCQQLTKTSHKQPPLVHNYIEWLKTTFELVWKLLTTKGRFLAIWPLIYKCTVVITTNSQETI